MLLTPEKPSFRTALLVLGLSLATFQHTQGQVAELITDRPDQTESSETVAPGTIQFEFGWTHREDDEGMDVTSDAFPETLVRIGIVDDLELRLGFDGYIWQDVDDARVEDGAGDLEVGLKWKLREEAGCQPQTAILAGTSVPAGEAPFSSERFDPSIRLACSHTLTEQLALGYNVGGLWTSEEDTAGDRDTTASVAYTIVLGITLSERTGTFIEFFGEAPTSEGKPANSFDAGMTYLIADNVQVDVLGGIGLSEDADDWFVGAGLVWRLPQ